MIQLHAGVVLVIVVVSLVVGFVVGVVFAHHAPEDERRLP